MFVTKEEYNKVTNTCRDVAICRNERYGDSIQVCSDVTLIELCQMKLQRTKKLNVHDDKYTDEIQDCINYLVYIMMRRNK